MAGLEDLNLKQSFMRQMAKVLSAKKSIIMRKQQNYPGHKLQGMKEEIQIQIVCLNARHADDGDDTGDWPGPPQ